MPSGWTRKNSNFHQSKLTQLIKNWATFFCCFLFCGSMTNSWVYVHKIRKNTDDTQRSNNRLLRSLLSHRITPKGLYWGAVVRLQGWCEVFVQEQSVGFQGSIASMQGCRNWEWELQVKVAFSTLGSSAKQGRARYTSRCLQRNPKWQFFSVANQPNHLMSWGELSYKEELGAGKVDHSAQLFSSPSLLGWRRHRKPKHYFSLLPDC